VAMSTSYRVFILWLNPKLVHILLMFIKLTIRFSNVIN
jgi:hypothetical protein